MKYTPSILPALCLALAACTQNARPPLQCNYYTPRYAQGFCIDTANGHKTLAAAAYSQQAGQPERRHRLGAPIERVVCMSTTHLGFLDFIQKTDAVVGVSAAKFIYNPLLQAAYSNGKIAEVGYGASVGIEQIARLRPDAVLAYGVYNEFEQAAQKLEELGIRTIYIGEYIEPHPLGKAEWVVAVAALFGCEEQARRGFDSIEREYLALTRLLPPDLRPVPCLLNAPWNDAWFMPCQQSNMAQYLHDAGGASVVPLRGGCTASPESIEDVYARAHDAECWLNAGNSPALLALGQMHKLIPQMPVFASGRVYNHNRRTAEGGGSDFFESGVMRPHLVLKDLISILHPRLLPNHELYYYQRVE